MLLRRPGRVYTRTQLIELALGSDYEGADRTIDTQVWSLRRKLGEPRGAKAIFDTDDLPPITPLHHLNAISMLGLSESASWAAVLASLLGPGGGQVR